MGLHVRAGASGTDDGPRIVHRWVAPVVGLGEMPGPEAFLARFEGAPRGFWGRGDRWVAWAEVLHEVRLDDRDADGRDAGGSRYARVREEVARFTWDAEGWAEGWKGSPGGPAGPGATAGPRVAPGSATRVSPGGSPGTPPVPSPGTAPRFFGGFSFLDDPEPNGSWSAFPRARFILPRVLLEAGPEGARVVVQRIGREDAEEDARDAEVAAKLAEALARVVLSGGGTDDPVEAGRRDLPPRLDAPAPLAVAPPPEPEPSPDESAVERDEAGWTRAVEAVLQALRAGGRSRAFESRDGAAAGLDADSDADVSTGGPSTARPSTRLEKAVLARTRDVSLSSPVSVPGLLRFLRHENRKAHVFVFEPEPGRVLFGAAPEILAELRGGRFRATAVAGSAPRGRTAHEEALFAGGLLASVKDREEHRMTLEEMVEVLTPRMRSLRIPPGPGVLTLARIQHLETPIEGEALPDQDALGLVEALHPTPAVCGRPRGTALEVIRAVEPFERGWYAGPVGWVDPSGDGDFVPVLRAGVGGGRQWRLYAGAGIVEGSDPHSEWEETALKFEPAHRALRAGVRKG